jgi:O-antigen/teichoic acid export membrane protein
MSLALPSTTANILKATVWTSGAIILVRVFFLLSSVVTAKLLSPEDFGFIGIAGTLFMLINTASATGIDSFLIFKSEPDQNTINTAFTLHFIVCTLFALLIMGLGFVVSDFYKQPALKEILIYAGLAFWVNTIGRIPRALLVKAMQQQRLAILDASVNFLNALLIMALAFGGFRYLSYVIPMLVSQLICMAGLFGMAKYPFRGGFSKPAGREILGYSKGFMPQTLLCDFLYQADYVIGGLCLSATLLGYYYFGFEKAFLVALLIRGLTEQVFFPVFSKTQNDPALLKKQYFQLSSHLMLALFPGLLLLTAFSKELLSLIYGNQWLPSLFTFQGILIFCLLKILYDVSITLLNATGKTGQTLRHFLWVTPPTLFMFYIGSTYGGLWGLTTATILAHGLAAFWMMFRIQHCFLWPVTEQLLHLFKHLALLILPCVALYFLKTQLESLYLPFYIVLSLSILCFLACYFVSVSLIMPDAVKFAMNKLYEQINYFFQSWLSKRRLH